MARSIFVGTMLAISVLALTPRVESASNDAPGDRPSVACVESWPEARYRNSGFDHVVNLVSHCNVAVTCDVSTNVSPDPRSVTLGPGQRAEVVTFRGAPTRTFVPRVACWVK